MQGTKNIPFKIILAGLAALFFAFIFLLTQSKFFIIKSIEVQLEKVSCADKDTIKNAVYLLNQNIFFVDSPAVEKKLKDRFICIKSLQLIKKIPDNILLKVFGREPAAILISVRTEASPSSVENLIMESTASATDSFIIDKEGIVYLKNEFVSAPKIYAVGINLSLGQKINGGLIENLLKILDKVKEFGIDFKDTEIFSEKFLFVNANPKIIFRLDNIDIQIASLQLILNKAKIDEESLEFIDLRFDKPIVRIAPKKK